MIRLASGSWLALVGLLTLPSMAAAQTCQDTETIGECWGRLSGEHPEVADAVAAGAPEEESQDRLNGKLTELGAAALAGEAFSIADFLPFFAGSIGMSEHGAEDGAKSIQFNLPISFPSGAPHRIRVEAIMREPTLYAPLAGALPDSVRASRVAELEKGFDELDDIEIVGAFNLETERFGRSFGRYAELYGSIFSHIVTSISSPIIEEANEVVFGLGEFSEEDIDEDRQECVDSLTDPDALRFDCLTSQARRNQIESQLAAAVVTEQRLDSLVQQELETNGFFRFADLINNQPQLSVEVAHRARSGLVGPDEWRAKIRYEHGLKNVNDLLNSCMPDEDRAVCAVRYLGDTRTVASLTRGDRLWLAAEYGEVSPFSGTIAQEGDTARVSLGVQQRFTGSAGFGRSVGVAADGTETGRMDFALEWEWTGDDPSREENRAIFSANYSQRINADLSLGVGLVWASKPEFLGAVDRKFSSHFGLRYKLSHN